MEALYAPQSRAERLIAVGRVVLAASSLFAVWLDPSEPARRPPMAYGLLAAYLVYAAAVAVWVARSPTPLGRSRVVTHAVDLVFFSLFITFTAGPASPFFAYFVFSLVCAAMRWSWQGTLWTAGTALLAFLAVGLYFAGRDPASPFALDEMIIRAVYLAVVAVLLAYLGAHERQIRRDMAHLAALPRRPPDDRDALVGEVIDYAQGVLEARRMLLAWCPRGDAPGQLWTVEPGAAPQPERWSGPLGEPLVAATLAGESFLCPDLGHHPPRVLLARGDRFERWSGPPLAPAVRERVVVAAVLSVPLAGQLVEGRLFFLDEAARTSDQLVLAEIVAGVAAARLDQLELARRLRTAAASEERVRLARDLHDGLLQALTGIALRLEAMRRKGMVSPATDLEELQQRILQEQRDLRYFIRELRPAESEIEPTDLGKRLRELTTRIERDWDLEVDLDAPGLDGELPEGRAREVYHLVREALANARRHGDAHRVRVRLRATDGALTLEVEDDGCGFPFHGEYSGEQLARMGAGPRSLRERAAALGGTLWLRSTPQGAHVRIEIPAYEEVG